MYFSVRLIMTFVKNQNSKTCFEYNSLIYGFCQSMKFIDLFIPKRKAILFRGIFSNEFAIFNSCRIGVAFISPVDSLILLTKPLLVRTLLRVLLACICLYAQLQELQEIILHLAVTCYSVLAARSCCCFSIKSYHSVLLAKELKKGRAMKR